MIMESDMAKKRKVKKKVSAEEALDTSTKNYKKRQGTDKPTKPGLKQPVMARSKLRSG